MDKFKADKHFEERLVQALIVDSSFAEQAKEILDLNYFNIEYLKIIVGVIFNYNDKYRAFPSFKLLRTVIKEEIKDETLQEQIMTFFVKIHKEPLNGDMQYIKESAIDFCRKRKLAIALENSLSFIEERKYEQISQEIQKALQVGSERDYGHSLVEDFESRMIEEIRKPVPTPWHEVNKKLKGGGVSGGDLSVVLANSGVGKSHALIDIGAHNVMNGKNVAHITLELAESATGNRYDARISNVDINFLKEHKEEVRKSLESLSGKLYIKAYPVGGASVQTIKNYLYKLSLRDFVPDLIIIDYADLMRSSKQYEQRRLEEANVFRELRALSQELNVPIWTATQSNRSGEDLDILTLKHVAESYEKAQVSDFFLTMTRKKDDTKSSVGNFFIAKNRLGPDGIRLPIIVNTSISKIEALSPDSIDDSDGDSGNDLKQKFRKFIENSNK